MKTRRSVSGVALPALPLVVLALAVGPAQGSPSEWAEYRDLPSSSRGGIAFQTDVVTFYEGEGRNVEEIYTTIPNDQIEFVETERGFSGRLRYSVLVSDGEGRRVEASEKIVEVAAASEEDTRDRSVVQVLQSAVTLAPGTYRVAVSIADLNALERTILSYLFKRYKTGEVAVLVESPGYQGKRLALSDIEFARSLRRREDGAFQKSGYEVVPNATRRYGLLLAEMAVFFEVYNPEGSAPDTVTAVYSIMNRSGGEIYRNEKPMAIRGRRFASTALFDVTSLPAGSYLLSIALGDSAGGVLARSERRFDVAWSVLSWGKSELEKVEDMTFVFTESELATFEALSPGEKEQFLQEFWQKLDPTPGTAENEALGEHYRRVAFSDQHYGTARARGALTDRGKIYIKYGPPDDVQAQFSDYEFVRDKRDLEGSDALADPFARVGIKAEGSGGSDVLSDQRGGTTIHGKSYETWVYDGVGSPIRRLSRRVGTAAGMRFIFVDDKGIGDYRMIYSTEKQEY